MTLNNRAKRFYTSRMHFLKREADMDKVVVSLIKVMRVIMSQ